MYICIYIYMLCGAFSDAFQPERKMAGNGEIDFQQAKTLPLDNFSILDHPWFCQIRLWEMLQSSGKQAVSVWTRPRIVWNVLYSWTFSMLRWCTGWQSSSMAKEGKELVPFFHRFSLCWPFLCLDPNSFMPCFAGEIEDAVNQPADLLIRAEACDLCRIVLRQLAVSELFEGSAEADRGWGQGQFCDSLISQSDVKTRTG